MTAHTPITAPSPQEGFTGFLSYSVGIIQTIAALRQSRSIITAQPHSTMDLQYDDEKRRCWNGDGGLTYRVPLVDIPSVYHCKVKSNNIRVMMDNVSEMATKDLLPCTPEELKFWSSYPYLSTQLFLEPFLGISPVLYLVHRYVRQQIPMLFRTRVTPFAVSAMIAEQAMEANYPAYELLATALKARTPLGDAARADWVRVQTVTIPPSLYLKYRWHRWMLDPFEGFEFGGNIVKACQVY